MADTCPICLGSSVNKLKSYRQESELPSLADHQSADGKLSCELDVSPGNHSAARRSE
jgi:hypothetical protein